jgi:hypothetical protein
MNALTPKILEYYETFLCIADTENIKVGLPAAENAGLDCGGQGHGRRYGPPTDRSGNRASP